MSAIVQRSRPNARRPVLSESELGRTRLLLRRRYAARAVPSVLEEQRLGDSGVHGRAQRFRLVLQSGRG
jgi:hypothetical protein